MADVAADQKKKDDEKSRMSAYWNITKIKYDKYNPVDETPHLVNVGREVAEMFEGESKMGLLLFCWFIS